MRTHKPFSTSVHSADLSRVYRLKSVCICFAVMSRRRYEGRAHRSISRATERAAREAWPARRWWSVSSQFQVAAAGRLRPGNGRLQHPARASITYDISAQIASGFFGGLAGFVPTDAGGRGSPTHHAPAPRGGKTCHVPVFLPWKLTQRQRLASWPSGSRTKDSGPYSLLSDNALIVTRSTRP
jgi:hypothetical protein